MGTPSLTPPLWEPTPTPSIPCAITVLSRLPPVPALGEMLSRLREAAWATEDRRRGHLPGQHGHLGHRPALRLLSFTSTIPWASQKQAGIE